MNSHGQRMKNIWTASRMIADERHTDTPKIAELLGVPENDSLKAFVEKTHAAGVKAMPARSQLFGWMRDEGHITSPKSEKTGATRARDRKAKATASRSKPAPRSNSPVIKRAMAILKSQENLKTFCERAGIAPASAYKWRSGNEPMSELSATRIVNFSEKGNRSTKIVRGRASSPMMKQPRPTPNMASGWPRDIAEDIDILARAKGIEIHDMVKSIVSDYIQQPRVRTAVAAARRHMDTRTEMEKAVQAI